MILEFKLSGFFVDKPITHSISLDPEQNAVELPDSTILKVKQLKGEALEQYIYEKYIKGTSRDGRVISFEIKI